MKKISVLAVAFVATAFLAPGNAHAQKYQGQINTTAGTSFSLTGLVVNAFLNAVDNAQGVETTSIPGINTMVDYGVSDRFSLGAAYYYQSFTTNLSGYTDSSGQVVSGDYYIRITRQNAGLRTLFHFGDNDDLDLYAGARIGMTFWSWASDIPNNSGVDFDDVIRSRVLPQGIFGMRYYFTPVVGVNLELAAGPPYFMMLGVNARFGGVK